MGDLRSNAGQFEIDEEKKQSVTFRDDIPQTASPKLKQDEIRKAMAARMIERAWLSYRDRKMYALLKHATCAAENSLSYEILRKVAPKEAQLLKDRGMPVKVRFRHYDAVNSTAVTFASFGGHEFPPMIYFKIFSDTSVTRVKYLSGKKAIKPATKAAQEACDQMGRRKFLEIMVQDTMFQQRYKVTDELDVTTLKDYMQYLSHIDELPCYMGGKDNSWRKLTLDVIPRQTIFYDIVDFLYHKNMTDRLKQELPILIRSPINAELEMKHIETISRMSTPPPLTTNTTRRSIAATPSQQSGRRSKQARSRVQLMRKAYGFASPNIAHKQSSGELAINNEEEYDFDDDELLNDEAEKLFQWTQELSFDELDRMSSIQVL